MGMANKADQEVLVLDRFTDYRENFSTLGLGFPQHGTQARSN